MVTTFEELRGYMRSMVGDLDSNAYKYSNDLLDSHIRLAIMTLDESSIREEGSSKEFTIELSNVNKARMIYYAAKSLIVNIPDQFSYKTPILSVVRRGGIRQLLAHFEEQIGNLEGGTFAVSSDQFIDAFLRGTERFIDEFSNA